MTLDRIVPWQSERVPERCAVRGHDQILTYGQLDRLANQIAHILIELGVGKGDRVAIWLDKTSRAVATTQAVLRLGAAYVPIDPLMPALRARRILEGCAVRGLVSSGERVRRLIAAGFDPLLGLLAVDEAEQGLTWRHVESAPDSMPPDPGNLEDDLAYILYTSGSTGEPKGVCLSHRNALAFVSWVVSVLETTPDDCFANHAPLHFDLSVLDLYGAFSSGGSVSLIPDGMSYVAGSLVEFIRSERISIWYSVPSVLQLMMENGLLDHEPGPLRAVLFAGEPFPIRELRRLRNAWPSVRLLNLYGPTETNVCTWYEVKQIEADRSGPVPIGRACCGDEAWAVREDGQVAVPGEEGELMVSGPTVMLGYWGAPPQAPRPYATGDLVRLQHDGNYRYLGRRDHMVKVRGYRVEPGDIEAALHTIPGLRDAGVVVAGEGLEARLVAFLVCAGFEEIPLLQVKKHCAERLPRYMIPDRVRYLETMPRTRNGKLDRRELARLAEHL